jgi:hypothetical protein
MMVTAAGRWNVNMMVTAAGRYIAKFRKPHIRGRASPATEKDSTKAIE